MNFKKIECTSISKLFLAEKFWIGYSLHTSEVLEKLLMNDLIVYLFVNHKPTQM